MKIIIGLLLLLTTSLPFVGAAYDFDSKQDKAAVFTGGGATAGMNAVKSEISGSGVIEEGNLIKVILGWVKFFLAILAVIAFIAFLWSGTLYITAFMNEENAETAKKVMMWTAIGIIIILLSYALTNAFIEAKL